jgi:predicted GTPase
MQISFDQALGRALFDGVCNNCKETERLQRETEARIATEQARLEAVRARRERELAEQKLREEAERERVAREKAEAERRLREAQEVERKSRERKEKEREREVKRREKGVAESHIQALTTKIADTDVLIARLNEDLVKGRETSSGLNTKLHAIDSKIESEKAHLRDDLLIDNEVIAKDSKGIRVLNVLLFGPTGHGKSTSGNKLAGVDDAFVVSESAMSETSSVKTVRSKRDCGDGCVMNVTDAPGTSDSDGKDDRYANAIVEHLRGIGALDAIILVKMATVKRFDSNYLAMLRSLEARFGVDMWRNCVLLLTAVPKREAQSRSHIEYRKSIRTQLMDQFPSLKAAHKRTLPIVSVDHADAEHSEQLHDALAQRIIPKLNKGTPLRCEVLKSPIDEMLVKRTECATTLCGVIRECGETEAKLKELTDARAEAIVTKDVTLTDFLALETKIKSIDSSIQKLS